jgi:hypothetical protein
MIHFIDLGSETTWGNVPDKNVAAGLPRHPIKNAVAMLACGGLRPIFYVMVAAGLGRHVVIIA